MLGARLSFRAAFGSLVALATIIGGTTVADSSTAAAAGATIVNVATADFGATSDISGCGITEDRWELCLYFQHGVESFASVVKDRSDAAGGDGSLRMATPGQDDHILLEYFGYDDGRGFPRFDEMETGTVAMEVLGGTAPGFTLYLECPGGEPGVNRSIRYAGPRPAAGDGWQTVDLVQGGQALWQQGTAAPEPLEAIQARCVGGVVRGHAMNLASPGADTRLDALTLGQRTVNFWVPPLTRVPGTSHDGIGGNLAARQFSAEDTDDDWTYPARARLHLGKAGVIAHRGSFQTGLVAGPLANAVHGPLLVNQTRDLEFHNYWALRNALPQGARVFLVGDRSQLSGKVARKVREAGFEVVRVAGKSYAATAVKTAQIIDRHRPAGRRPLYVVTSGSRYEHSLTAPATAGSRNGAVLLTRGSTMPTVTREYLRSHRPASVFAVGPGAARAMPRLADARKLFGRNRYVTAAKVAARFFPAPDAVVLVGGSRPTDGLLGAAHAGLRGRPLLVVGRDVVPAAVRDYIAARQGGLEGESLLVADVETVSDATFDNLFDLLRVG